MRKIYLISLVIFLSIFTTGCSLRKTNQINSVNTIQTSNNINTPEDKSTNLNVEQKNEEEKTQNVIVNNKYNVDTGQTKCYDTKTQINCSATGSFSGQDAQYLSNAPAYTNNGDGTITDVNTGLMWQKNPGDKLTYSQALTKLKTFKLAGYDDWRVPTIKELYSLINFNGKDISSESTVGDTPFMDTNYFDFSYGDLESGDRIIDSQWVTDSIYKSKVMNGQECFFGVNFADGRIKCYPTQTNKTYYAIFVRGNTDYQTNNFVYNGNGTITDTNTGLMWQELDSGQGMNWGNALAYCENLNLVNQTDWRLPNAKELEKIVDYNRSPDTTNSAAINSVFKVSSITNELGQRDFPFYWTSTTHADSGGGSSAVYVAFGRAMGNMNGKWMDVHGAGAQRSDPKEGDPSDYPNGHGPQGDAIRIYNYVRCVRGGDTQKTSGDEYVSNNNVSNNQNETNLQTKPQPPQEAINACENKSLEDNCSFSTPKGLVSGTCLELNNQLACIPPK